MNECAHVNKFFLYSYSYLDNQLCALLPQRCVEALAIYLFISTIDMMHCKKSKTFLYYLAPCCLLFCSVGYFLFICCHLLSDAYRDEKCIIISNCQSTSNFWLECMTWVKISKSSLFDFHMVLTHFQKIVWCSKNCRFFSR